MPRSAAAALVLFGVPCFAGPLLPPAGPVSPTYKTLDDVEPRVTLRNDFVTLTPIVISSPGSYYLAENIDAFFGQHGIGITASDVTLDLNGFRILGNTEVGSLDGVHLSTGLRNVTIRNGTIESFFGDGINAIASEDLTVEGVRVQGNGDDGLQSGVRTIVRACAASGNTNYGFRIGAHSVITDSTASGNTNWIGFSTGVGSSVRGCTADNNGHHGFGLGSYSTAENCTADTNGGSGFNLSNGSSATNCTARSNTDDGFTSFGPGTVTGCTARNNTGNGISVSFSTDVSACAANDNTGHGILVGGEGNRIANNTCYSNNLTGIQVANLRTGNRIEANNAVGNSIGIDIQGTDNLMIGNSASGNALNNYAVFAGNAYGTIINVAGGGAFASDQPWANLEY